MPTWRQLSDDFLAAHSIDSSVNAESRVGPTDGIVSAESLAAFKRCEPTDAVALTELLRDPIHRVFVKLLCLAALDVPEPLFGEVVAAGVATENPSFNKHFIFPAAIVHGRRRVLQALLNIFAGGSDREKYGVSGAVYWCSIPRPHMHWPHQITRDAIKPEPDDAIDDLVARFEDAALAEFVANSALDVRRALVPQLSRAALRSPALGAQALAIARGHSDEYIRSRLRADLDESSLIPSKPKPTGVSNRDDG